MKSYPKSFLLLALLSFVASASFAQKSAIAPKKYCCTPCGIKCDKELYDKPGTCTHCKMPLVEKKTITHSSVAPAALAGFLKSTPGLVVLDVRTKEEFEGKADPDFGTLRNAINIPISELEKGAYSKLDKNKTILVYCSHSHRSSRVSYLLTQNGFKKVVNLLGGMSEVNDKSVLK